MDSSQKLFNESSSTVNEVILKDTILSWYMSYFLLTLSNFRFDYNLLILRIMADLIEDKVRLIRKFTV